MKEEAGKLTVYYDIGTTNMRLFLLDEKLEPLQVLRKTLGAKDSAIARSNLVLLGGMKDLFEQALAQTGMTEDRVGEIYASGMATSPYGIVEIPHCIAPITDRDFAARGVTSYLEQRLFRREIFLIAGLKTIGDDISSVNNTRGEEIEVLGALPEVERRFPGEQLAMILPGSHTHVLLAGQGKINGILSNFTGELFHALRQETILAPVLQADSEAPDPEAVRLGLWNVRCYGFNRALYIGHAMRIFEEGTPQRRRSYCEAVISGGVITALDAYCADQWPECTAAIVIGNRYMCRLFRILLEDSRSIRRSDAIILSEEKNFALEGFRRIIGLREEMRHE